MLVGFQYIFVSWLYTLFGLLKSSESNDPQKKQTSEGSDKMSQVLANPESSDPQRNNDFPKEET